MEGLCAAQYRRERLHGDTDDVVVRLLRCESAAGGLCMEAKLLGARALRAESIAHQPRPEPARCAALRDLLEEVVVRVEEARELLAEAVNRQARIDCGLHVGDRVGQ